MAKGDGSIIEVKRKDGGSYNPKHWKIRLDLGNDPITGKRHVKSRTIEGTKTEARKKRDEMRRELEQGIKPDSDKMTFRDMVQMFCDARREAEKVTEGVLRADESRLRYVCDFIGDLPLKSIDAQTVENLMAAIRKQHIQAGGACCNTTLAHYFRLVKAVFKRAVKYDYLLKNPCDKVENVPRPDPVERRSLNAEEVARLLSCVDASEEAAYEQTCEKEARQRSWSVKVEDRSYLLGMADISNLLAVRIGLATGMRRGEILSLRWCDLTGNVLTVRRSTTKTDSGARRIIIDDTTLQHVLTWKEYQRELLASIKVEQTEQTNIVCTGTGSAVDGNNFRHWWDVWKAKNGFPDLLFHELRHTQATLLLANGVDVKTVQKRLGHAKSSITLDFYSHAIPDNDEKAANLIAAIASGKKKARIIRLSA